MRALPIVVLCAAAASAEIVDRVAVAIESQVITQSALLQEIRVTAFLNGEKPDLSPASRRRTADRMVEQALMQREMQLTRFPAPDHSEIEDTLRELRGRSGSQAGFQAALRDYGITEQELEQALIRQATVLNFIDLRFRPEVQVQDADVLRYYQNVFVPEAQRKHINPVPPFDEVRGQCEEVLAQQAVDQRVEAWLKEARSRTRIRYEEDAFQ